MKRQVALIALVLAVACVGFFGSRASGGGGGCHDPVKTRTTSAIRIKSFCFDATVALVEPGTTVTWTNRENVQHNVALVNSAWASKGLGLNDSVSYRFEEPGVYPYACLFHPGMSGAVVVGEPKVGTIGPRNVGTPKGFTDFKRGRGGGDVGGGSPVVQNSDKKLQNDDIQAAASRNQGKAFYVFLVFVGALVMTGLIFLTLNRGSGTRGETRSPR